MACEWTDPRWRSQEGSPLPPASELCSGSLRVEPGEKGLAGRGTPCGESLSVDSPVTSCPCPLAFQVPPAVWERPIGPHSEPRTGKQAPSPGTGVILWFSVTSQAPGVWLSPPRRPLVSAHRRAAPASSPACLPGVGKRAGGEPPSRDTCTAPVCVVTASGWTRSLLQPGLRGAGGLANKSTPGVLDAAAAAAGPGTTFENTHLGPSLSARFLSLVAAQEGVSPLRSCPVLYRGGPSAHRSQPAPGGTEWNCN